MSGGNQCDFKQHQQQVCQHLSKSRLLLAPAKCQGVILFLLCGILIVRLLKAMKGQKGQLSSMWFVTFLSAISNNVTNLFK